MPMEFHDIALVGAIFFFAAFVKGTVGLGFSTAALGPLALTIGIKAALPVLIVPSLTSNAVVMAQTPHFREMLDRFFWLFCTAIVGVALGLMILVWVDGTIAGAFLGTVLIAYCWFAWRNPHITLAPRWERPASPIVGLATGVINGLTGSQVMPLLPYLMALRLSPERLIQATNISFSVSSLAMAIGLLSIGLLTPNMLFLSVLGVIPVVTGVTLGTRARAHLSQDQFKALILVILTFSGLILILRAFLYAP